MPFPIDIKYISETEQELELIFPESFKTKMTKENGGELTTKDDDWQIFPFFDKSDHKRISRTANHIVLETKQARNWGNFPANGIAIASNGSGDFLLLLPTKENQQQLSSEIFSWFHETGEVRKIANHITEFNFPISKPIHKKQIIRQKLTSLKTDYGFRLDNIPSPWTLMETVSSNKPSFYAFQIGKGTECLVSLETSFPTKQLENDKYWLDLWVKETGLKKNIDDLNIERPELENYSCIIVKSKNWTPVFYWFKSHLTEKWYLKMTTGASRHKGDFKEFIKILDNIQVDR
ncbi:MAG: SMI1/KNR4 family protein [Flavobacterium sp.]|nr:MAG: SMI1/KNR4 family protein [Flavobacterium sp.]